MTSIPPYFAAQMEESKKWDNGFRAGIAEVLDDLAELTASDEVDESVKDWAKDFGDKVTKKYL
jgi:hypothetical protein|tara:strand:- start:2652 stop:2840 length:189 start_codon:yes stop_codon:yes gene_type:complete